MRASGDVKWISFPASPFKVDPESGASGKKTDVDIVAAYGAVQVYVGRSVMIVAGRPKPPPAVAVVITVHIYPVRFGMEEC